MAEAARLARAARLGNSVVRGLCKPQLPVGRGGGVKVAEPFLLRVPEHPKRGRQKGFEMLLVISLCGNR